MPGREADEVPIVEKCPIAGDGVVRTAGTLRIGNLSYSHVVDSHKGRVGWNGDFGGTITRGRYPIGEAVEASGTVAVGARLNANGIVHGNTGTWQSTIIMKVRNAGS